MFSRVIFSVVFLLASASSAFSQDIPSTVAPGSMERYRQEHREITPPREIDIPQTQMDNTPPSDAANIKLTPSNVIIEGNTVYSKEKLKSYYNNIIGKEVSLSAIFDVATKITDLYQNDGYFLSFALVPAQRIKESGEVKITIVEGFIDKVSFNNLKTHRKSLFNKLKSRVEAERPIKKETLEKFILLTEMTPGISVDTFIEASKTTPGASNLQINIRNDNLDGQVAVNNYGSRYAGPIREESTLSLNSLLGLNEQISFSNTDTLKEREEKYAEVSTKVLINSLGTSIKALYSQDNSEPGFTLRNNNIASKSEKAQLSFAHPLMLSRSKNLTLTGSAEMYDSEVEAFGARLSKDSLRVIRTGLEYVDTDNNGSYRYMFGQISKGLDLFGAKESKRADLSRANGKSNFAKLTAEGGVNKMLTNKIGMLVAAKGQWAGSQMLSSEEFSFGGRQFGRGYDSSELVGDHGVSGLVELDYYGHGGGPFQSYKLYSFYDIGAVWSIDSDQVDDRKMGSSAGIGVRLDLQKHVVLNVEGNRPLTRDAAFRGKKDEEDGQLKMELKVIF